MRVKDVSADMGEICRRNREREAALAQWQQAHTRNGVRSYWADELADMPPSPKYIALDDDGWIAIDTGDGNYYDFNAAEIETPLELLEWIDHLCGKRWMDAERVRQLVLTVCDARGWPAKIERY